MSFQLHKVAMVALLFGSAILLFSCGKAKSESDSANNETLMTERSEHLTILMSENGRRSYHFKTPLLEGYTMASDPYREFRKGIHITTYQDDGNPLPSFAGEPVSWAMVHENFSLFGQHIWQSLNQDNKVSLFTRQINLETGEAETQIFNKNEGE